VGKKVDRVKASLGEFGDSRMGFEITLSYYLNLPVEAHGLGA